MKLSFDDKESLKEAVGSLCLNIHPSNPSPNTLQRMPVGNMLPQDSERNEDICFNNLPSDPNVLRRVGSSNSPIAEL